MSSLNQRFEGVQIFMKDTIEDVPNTSWGIGSKGEGTYVLARGTVHRTRVEGSVGGCKYISDEKRVTRGGSNLGGQ